MVALLAIPILLVSLQTVSSKEYQKEVGITSYFTSLMNVFASISGFLIVFSVNGFRIRLQPESIIIGIVLAVSTLIYREFQVKAMGFGPVAALTIVNFSAQSLGPFVYGISFLNEDLTVFKICGVILMLVSMLPLMKNGTCKISNPLKFWINSMIVFVTCVIINVSVKMNQVVSSKEFTNDFISFYYLVFIGLSIAVFSANALHKKKSDNKSSDGEKFSVAKTINKKIILWGTLIGVFNVTANIISQRLASVIDASIQFPIMSSGQIITTVLLSMLLFKEKPTRNTVISIVLNISSIILMSL